MKKQPAEQNEPFCPGKSIGSCGGAGMCPGIALMISFGAWVGLTSVFGSTAIAWLAAVPLWLLLVTGYWRRTFTQ